MDPKTFDSIWNKPSRNYKSDMRANYPHRNSPEEVTVSDKLVQTRDSFECMINHAAQTNPKIILEIGTGKGVACIFYDELVGHNGLIITMNLSDQLDMDVEDVKSEWHRLIMNSASPEALQAVKDILGDRKVDFLFIDGEHEASHFLKDFANYWPLVRVGGIAAFHDCDLGHQIRKTYDEHPGRKMLCDVGINIGIIVKE